MEIDPNEREYDVVGPRDRSDPRPRRQRKKGPKRGNYNCGRPRVILSDNEWRMIELMVGRHCTISEVCGVMKLVPRTLERLIADHYALTIEDFWVKYLQAGNAKLRESIYNMACDGKHPVVTIFCAINWLGMQDTRTIVKKDESGQNKESTALLEAIKDTLNKITTKPVEQLPNVNNNEEVLNKNLTQLTVINRTKDFSNIEEAQVVDDAPQPGVGQ